MSEKKSGKASGISFEALSSLDAPVSFWRGIPFGLQHVMAMFVANLAPARFTGVTSEGMLLAATNNACGCQVIFVDDIVPEGTRIC